MTHAHQLQELVDQWRRLAVSGVVLTADDLCLDYPELREELQKRIDELRHDPMFVETRMPGDSDVPATRPDDTPTPPVELDFQGRFDSLQFYKRGGLGELYVGQEPALQRQVALKFIQVRYADDPETRARFVAEAEITARLDHPGVVPVYGLGRTEEGRPFLVMRLIRGRTLDEGLEEFHRRGPSDPGERSVTFRNLVSRVVSVCHTLAYAHNRGILHRDVKPQNIMLGRYGETLVVDWGLAIPVSRSEMGRASGEETLTPESSHNPSSSGGAVGTPSYMSPEQAHGDIPLTPTSDVYSLGATLYKVLTGVVPMSGRSSSEILEKVKRGDFRPPRWLHPDIPRPLESICLKAMAFSPDRRYATTSDLAADLERWLADEPVTAYRERGLEWGLRMIRRHRTWAQAIGLTVLALLLIGVPAGLWFRSSLVEQDRVAKQLRVNRLREAATYAAATFAAEIDLRWRILQRDAEDPFLKEQLRSGRPFAKIGEPLGKWIGDKFTYNREFANADSWFIIDTGGVQVARHPVSATTGRSYRFRTYFHGGELDLSEDEAKNVAIYDRVHRSIVFEGTTTRKPQITFSVPIVDDGDDRRVLGRLAMTVQLGKFRSLNGGLGEGQAALLVDLHKYQRGRAGVVLQHPAWEQALPAEGSIDTLPTVPPALVDQLNALRQKHAASKTAPNLVLAWQDPVGGSHAGEWLATFEPVFVKQRGSSDMMDTGLMVVVETR